MRSEIGRGAAGASACTDAVALSTTDAADQPTILAGDKQLSGRA